MQFQGKNAVITGGNSGIGLAIAKRLHKEGARVALLGRDQQTLARAAAQIGGKTLAVNGDVTKPADLDRLMEQVQNEMGAIDILVANAGVAQFLPLEDIDEAHFDHQFGINVKGTLFTVQKALPLLNPGASVILMASAAAAKGFPGTIVYSATKAALRSLARTLSTELLPRNIRVNVISPGPITTPIFEKLGAPAEELEAVKQGFSDMVPLKRFGDPEEVAGVASFLASSDASYIVGADIATDGGLTQL